VKKSLFGVLLLVIFIIEVLSIKSSFSISLENQPDKSFNQDQVRGKTIIDSQEKTLNEKDSQQNVLKKNYSAVASSQVVKNIKKLNNSKLKKEKRSPHKKISQKDNNSSQEAQIDFIYLLTKPLKIFNQSIQFAFSKKMPPNWLVEIDYQLFSKEDALGFDKPGLTIALNDKLVYQQSAPMNQSKKIIFNPYFFSLSPNILTIYSGNTVDEQKDTFTIINQIILRPKIIDVNQQLEPILDLSATKETVANLGQFVTLEWTTPKVNSKFLDRPLSYQIKSFSQPLTDKNWQQAKLITPVLPVIFSPFLAGEKQMILVEKNSNNQTYIAVRAVSYLGELSTLKQGSQVLVE
jgi:hypothetical protein